MERGKQRTVMRGEVTRGEVKRCQLWKERYRKKARNTETLWHTGVNLSGLNVITQRAQCTAQKSNVKNGYKSFENATELSACRERVNNQFASSEKLIYTHLFQQGAT
jgi:hypothetical protein